MIRWIAFDVETADTVVSRFKRGGAEIHQGTPLAAAIELGRPSLLMLPSMLPGRILVARVQPRDASRPSAELPRNWEPTGFLGLSDSPIFSEPEPVPPPRKRWWRRSA